MTHHVLQNGTLAYWKKVGIICGGILTVIGLSTAIWKGASFGAALGWQYANRENAYALNQIVDRLTALQVRDSVTNVRLSRLENERRVHR